MQYAELQITTNYSFLRSGSHPGEFDGAVDELARMRAAAQEAVVGRDL